MTKIIVLSFITLDGVMQAPGGPEEDKSGGFKYGGWSFPFFDDFMGNVMADQIGHPFDLLLGKKTYDIFVSYWPNQDEQTSLVAKAFNKAKKFVVSHLKHNLSWKNSVVLHSDVVNEIKKLKEGDGPEIQVHGSGNLIQTLLKNDLVDELWLKIFPITLGPGKRLFAEGSIPASFKLTQSKVSPSGVIIANYKREGEIHLGSF